MAGFALAPGDGAGYLFHGAAVVIKAAGDQTLGHLAVMESTYPGGLSVHEHVHAGEDEMFYLLAGEMSVFCEQDRWTAKPGSFVFVPHDRPHGFTVTSEEPARALVITGPAQLDRQIAQHGQPIAGPRPTAP
jgi:quercetin dioxygenase-like cupin family protein